MSDTQDRQTVVLPCGSCPNGQACFNNGLLFAEYTGLLTGLTGMEWACTEANTPCIRCFPNSEWLILNFVDHKLSHRQPCPLYQEVLRKQRPQETPSQDPSSSIFLCRPREVEEFISECPACVARYGDLLSKRGRVHSGLLTWHEAIEITPAAAVNSLSVSNKTSPATSTSRLPSLYTSLFECPQPPVYRRMLPGTQDDLLRSIPTFSKPARHRFNLALLPCFGLPFFPPVFSGSQFSGKAVDLGLVPLCSTKLAFAENIRSRKFLFGLPISTSMLVELVTTGCADRLKSALIEFGNAPTQPGIGAALEARQRLLAARLADCIEELAHEFVAQLSLSKL